MAFYVGNMGSAVATDHQWKIHHAMQPDDQRVGTFTLPNGAGIVPVTGVGFRPDVVVLITNLGGGFPKYSYGCATSADPSEQWAQATSIGADYTRYWYTEWFPGSIICGCSILTGTDPVENVPYVRATLQSLDADGFTLNVTMNDDPGGFTVAYLAMQGDFRAGVIHVQESIVDLPFEPTGLLLMGCKRTELSEISKTVDWSCGFASKEAFDMTENQQSHWSGNRRDHFIPWSHWQSTSRYCPGYIANWGLAQNLDNPASLFTTYQLWGKARVSSWEASSILLEWTDLIDNTPYQFGYLAMGIPCETGRWDWNWASFEPDKTAGIYDQEFYGNPARVGLVETLVEPVNAMFSMCPVAYGGSSGTYHTWNNQFNEFAEINELARGYNASFGIGAIDPTLQKPLFENPGGFGRWATSHTPFSWDSSVGPLRNNDPEPKNDEWYVALGEAPGSSATFVMSSAGGMSKGWNFPQANMDGAGSFLTPYGVGIGRASDIVHASPPQKRHLLPILHVGP